jgi:FkbM family methyltransferase
MTRASVRTAAGLPRTSTDILERTLIAYGRYCPIRRGKLRLVEMLWRSVAQGSALRTAHLNCGYRMQVDLREALQRQYYFTGTYLTEEAVLRAWRREARQAAVIFDVGANQGIYSLEALAANPRAVVHAFEPTQEIAAGLRRTAAMNGAPIFVAETAVSNRVGSARLMRCPGGNEGMNFITSQDGGERVPVTTLDAYSARHGIKRIDLLKMDIQGAEGYALEGAADLLEHQAIGTVFVELNWSDAPDCPAARVVEILTAAGFMFRSPTSRRWREAGPWLRKDWEAVAALRRN